MKNLKTNQVQSVMDSYSVGKIIKLYPLNEISFLYKKNKIILQRLFVETTQSVFLLIFSKNDSIHQAWWESTKSSFAKLLSGVLKLKNAKLLLNNSDIDTVHKYDLRFSVFAL